MTYLERLEIVENYANVVRRQYPHADQYINLSIILGQKYAVTDYCPEELIRYTKQMLDKYGDDPQESALQQMRREAAV